MPLSLVIRNGLVYDGLGGPPRHADVGVEDDRIRLVGSIPQNDAPEIDAAGLAVAPGFINVLSHAWQSIQIDPTCHSDLVQGVTTEVFGEAESLGPSSPALLEVTRSRGVDPRVRIEFDRLSQGLDHLERQGISVNVASFIGGHNLRALAAGLERGALAPKALDQLCALVHEEMTEGALGIGTALIYAPGSYADTGELSRLCEVVGEHDGLYISHLRSEGDTFLESLEELVTIGRDAGCRVECYHLKAGGSQNHPKMAVAIERIQRCREEGQEVSADMYPYTAAATALAASLPPSLHTGGMCALLDRLADDAVRSEVVRALITPEGPFENLFLGADGGRGILLLRDLADGTPSAGRYLTEVADMLGMPSLAAALVHVVRTDPDMTACYFVMSEANVQLGMSQPWVSFCSDAESGSALDEHGPFTHPRAYGSFARVLGHYSRDLKLFPLEEAVRKMTSLPARTLRLKDRGALTPGCFADLVVFDPRAIDGPADYLRPRQYATGVRHVVVNGQSVLADGVVLPARPGRRLRRAR